eukprot:749461-Prymnesium_polylepis.1
MSHVAATPMPRDVDSSPTMFSIALLLCAKSVSCARGAVRTGRMTSSSVPCAPASFGRCIGALHDAH